MIDEFVKVWDEHKDEVRAAFTEKHPESYEVVVKTVIELLARHIDDYGETPDPERIHVIDDGDYQGTLLFVIGGDGYQPDNYWFVKVGYGSCSGCDTLQAISGYSDEPPTAEQLDDYMTLALHVVQRLHTMQGEVVYE